MITRRCSSLMYLLVLALLTIITPSWAAVCDVNSGGVINHTDIALITAARNKAAVSKSDLRDADRDGKTTVLDARKCTLLCTYPVCAPNAAPTANAGADQTALLQL